MLLSISFVPVKQITSSVPRSKFSDEDIENIANLILKGEGIINPLILRSNSLESYEVVDGHFEYYAAARAREKDLRKGEMIGAFIIEPSNQESIEEQVKLLRNQKHHSDNKITNNNSNIYETHIINMESRITNIESRLTNLESRIEKRTNELQEEWKREIKSITNKINEIDSKLPKPIEPLDALNNLSVSELTSKLKRANVSQKIIDSILNERKNGNFQSFGNVVKRVEGLGDKTMLKIIDNFTNGII